MLNRGERYGYGDSLAGQVVELRVPYDTRAEVVADTLVRIVATQGGRAEVRHGEPVNLRPVPAPEDPAPLGADAARWALLYPASHDRPRISADHLLQRESNPSSGSATRTPAAVPSDGTPAPSGSASA